MWTRTTENHNSFQVLFNPVSNLTEVLNTCENVPISIPSTYYVGSSYVERNCASFTQYRVCNRICQFVGTWGGVRSEHLEVLICKKSEMYPRTAL